MRHFRHAPNIVFCLFQHAKTASIVSVCQIAILLLAASLLAGGQESQKPPIVKQESIGNTVNVHSCGKLFLAGQPQKEDLAKIAQRGIERIITLRTEGEIDWNEVAAAKAAGLEFKAIRFGRPSTLTDDIFDQVRKELATDTSTMLHCGSANRVGAVWLPFRVLDQNVPLEDALQEAKQIGLRSPGLVAKSISYIKRNQSADKKSVKPGINERFLDPNLKIEEWIDRFEVESREVFAERNNVLAACKIKKGMIVADIGAGTGLYSRLFATAVGPGGKVFAVDISKKFLAHIESTAEDAGIKNIQTHLGQADSVDLPEKSIDVAFVCDTYHHFEFPISTMQSIHRSLKDRGSLVVIDFERIPGKTREWLLSHVRAGKQVFRQEIESVGFALVEEVRLDGFKENYFLRFQKR